MPNSRLEVSSYLFLLQDQVENAWLQNGNNVSGGRIGTNSYDPFFFVASGVTRGGFKADGERFLQTQGNAVVKSELIEATFAATSVNASPLVLFQATLNDLSVYGFNANTQARRSSGLDRAAFERRVMAYREGGPAVLGKEHALFTDKSNAYSVLWQTSGNSIQLVAMGVSGHTVNWTGSVFYQGVQQS